MSKWVLATDSCSDLPNSLVESMNLKVIPLSVTIENKTYFHYPDERELSIEAFYDMLRNKKVAKTSLINVGEFLAFFEPILKEGNDILYIGFSSALSGTFQSSQIAAQELAETYPDRKIITVDSLSASMGQGLLVWHAYQEKLSGKSIEEVAKWIETNKLNLCHLFTVDDLGTLKRGGRLSETAAFLGTLLKVKPILHVSNEGKLVPIKKARGRQSSLTTIVELMRSLIVNPESQTIFISHGDSMEDAAAVGTMIQTEFKIKDIVYNNIGPIIGAHSGPGTISVFFVGNSR
ncbi:MAG TPA: DegV family protein [Bacilli bacterium]|nr:DegV family protein [Bacilli bacterium]